MHSAFLQPIEQFYNGATICDFIVQYDYIFLCDIPDDRVDYDFSVGDTTLVSRGDGYTEESSQMCRVLCSTQVGRYLPAR